ncbi:ParM/StbA family protein [Bacillus mexicanus]|uniref:ParM/StbA family protein n=1 Tax=Bacillus mexicanus TaxID=2834415 RepID=UPI003D1C548D
MEINLKGVVDAGNSEHGSMIDGKLELQPSTIAKTSNNPFYEDMNVEYAVENIFKHLVVNIDSTTVKSGTYFIGAYALDSNEAHQNTMLGVEKKYESDVPVIMTLGTYAAKAVQQSFEQNKTLPEKIKVKADMITGLPVREYDQETGKKFADRFMNCLHNVRVYLGKSKTVSVELEFEFVKVFPEAAPVVWSLWKDDKDEPRNDDIFKGFLTYKKPTGAEETESEEKESNEMFSKEVTGDYFSDKRILHIDIGEGTTEFPITEGLIPNQKLVKGSQNGIGHAIEVIQQEYADLINVPSVQRHTISQALKNKSNKYYLRALDMIQEPLNKQAQEIIRYAVSQVNKVHNELDIIVVYGGGSVLMKPHLYPKLVELCSDREIELLYIPEKFATTLYIEGLNNMLTNGVFEKIKKEALSQVG